MLICWKGYRCSKFLLTTFSFLLDKTELTLTSQAMTLSISSDNRTYYEISSLPLRYSLATYCFLTATFAAIGNIVVLVASMKYKCIKLDRVSNILIRNIAIADLAYSLCVMLQVGLALCFNAWPYGDRRDALCHLSTYLQHALAFTDINLICALNIAKLTCIMFPLKARLRSFRTGVVISAVVWLIANLYPLQAVKRDVYFDYRSYRCAYEHTQDYWVWLDPVNISLFLLLPTFTVLITTIWLLFYVRKVTGAHKQAVFTMLPVSIVFCLSYAPIGTYFVAEKWIIENAEPEPYNNSWYTGLHRYGMLVKFINNSANPIIYFVTIQSFRNFVLQKIFRVKVKSLDSQMTIRQSSSQGQRISRQLTTGTLPYLVPRISRNESHAVMPMVRRTTLNPVVEKIK